jgi:thiol-disulfide isomerase/thioredoxin
MQNIYLSLFAILSAFAVYANTNTSTDILKTDINKIRIEVEDYNYNTIQFGYYYGDKTYLKPDALTDSDVIEKQSDGKFVFNFENTLEPGVYIIVFKPDNKYVDVLIPEKFSPDFQITVSALNPSKTITVKGDNDENKLFYSYINFFNEKREIAQQYQKDDVASFKKIDDEVKAFQKKFIKKHKNRLVGKLMNASVQIEIPNFEGTEEEIQLQSWKYVKSHYFDNVDLADPALLRTIFLYNMVNTYIERLTVQHPDSISNAIDFILNKMEPAPETYKYYVVDFLNKYAKSKMVGMDAVYVHMANEYYAKGKAPWTEKEQLDKILSNAKAVEPTLIGKIAPELELEQANGISFNLDDLKSKYTILFFWNEECKNCIKEINNIKKFEVRLKKSGAEIVSVFYGENETYFKDYINNSEDMQHWVNTKIVNTSDQLFMKYNISTFPQFIILDQNQKIVSKRIGADQLLEVINLLQQ